ncbi:MAG TPA: glycosyltransferase, partial [Catenuloplanes sp.]
RALWGLGTAAARSTVPWIRREALVAFRIGVAQRSPWSHAMAFAGLGAAEVLRRHPRDDGAATLLADAAEAVGAPHDWADWPWPQDHLTYANAALAEVTISAGYLGRDEAVLDRGLRMLSWLHDLQLVDGRLSMVAVAGLRRHGPRDRYDQQSIEVAALADACATAARVTGDPAWNCGVQQAVAWFAGHNDQNTPMWDPATGGGYDGLIPQGANRNQGAESTLALLSTLQHARNLADTGRSPA